MVLQPLPSHQNKHRSQTRQEVSEMPVGTNILESPAALSSVTAFGIRRVKSEGSLGGGGRDACQPWGPASFLIILVQNVQKANWSFLFCSFQQRECCGWNQSRNRSQKCWSLGKLKGWSQMAEQEWPAFSGARSPQLSQSEGSMFASQCWLCSMITQMCVHEWTLPCPFYCFLECFREVTSEWAVFAQQLTPCRWHPSLPQEKLFLPH